MDITPPRENRGTEELKRTNRRRVLTETGQVERSRALASTSEWHEQSREAIPSGSHAAEGRAPVSREGKEAEWPFVERRSGKDRRQEQRRATERDVLFEARSRHERRTRLRRREDRERAAAELDAPPQRGIDVKV